VDFLKSVFKKES